jgi:hypothetical protein
MLRGEMPERLKNGRLPAFVPTAEQRNVIAVFAANGATKRIMADALQISPITLVKYFKAEMKMGRERVTARIGYIVVKEALAGNMAAARYWLDRRGGPEWQPPEGAPPLEDYDDGSDSEPRVQFYLPRNGRDEPEPDAMTIEGVVEQDKTGTDG